MRHVFIITSLFFAIVSSSAQTKEYIDGLIKKTISDLDQYHCETYVKEQIVNDDAMRYDTAYFYHNPNGLLVYLVWKSTSHTFHITGDNVDITEMFFIDNKVVYQRNYSYRFVNPQWHKEPDINETEIAIIESTRSYYKEDGTPLVEYDSRSAEGKYKDRFLLLDAIPLEQKLQRRWSERCDDCIEEEYLSAYRKLKEKQKN